MVNLTLSRVAHKAPDSLLKITIYQNINLCAECFRQLCQHDIHHSMLHLYPNLLKRLNKEQ
jgi:hypothetical protein